MTLPVLYRDECVIAVHKPSGLLVHRSAIDRHERRFALQTVRDQIGQRVYPVHRLDKSTSGILLFALNRESAHAIALQFSSQTVTKRYVALVRGWPTEPEWSMDTPLSEVEDDRILTSAENGPVPALTQARRLRRYEIPEPVDRYPTSRYSLVEVQPMTGRRHQIRRHLRRSGHPLIGDATYGAGRHNRFFAERFGARRLWLACTLLQFNHPLTGASIDVESPLAPEFEEVLRSLESFAVEPLPISHKI